MGGSGARAFTNPHATTFLVTQTAPVFAEEHGKSLCLTQCDSSCKLSFPAPFRKCLRKGLKKASLCYPADHGRYPAGPGKGEARLWDWAQNSRFPLSSQESWHVPAVPPCVGGRLRVLGGTNSPVVQSGPGSTQER